MHGNLEEERMDLSYDVGSSRALGRYALHGEIASGGMATVHFGRLLGAVGFARTVALKRLHAQYARDPEFVAMFLDEARLAARIRHPSVVPTLDVVSDGAELFLVMEYVHGESLATLLRLARPHLAPAPVVARIMTDVLHGLHAAHEATDERGAPLGVVHRDVSPQNVLVGVDGVARIVDFGIAKATGAIQSTREGVVKGKIGYMAPERLMFGVADRRADVYSAAVVLWEALTGQRLFAGDHEQAIADRVKGAGVSPPSTIVPQVPAMFDEVTMRGLARHTADRWASAREMATALEACGLATAFEVGEWVRSIAGPALAKRAACLAEIESGAPARAEPLHLPAAPAAVLEDDAEGEALTVERPRASERAPAAVAPPAPNKRGLLVALAAVLVVACAFIVGLRVVRARHAKDAAASVPPPPADIAATPDLEGSAAPPSTGGTADRPARPTPAWRHRPRAAPSPAPAPAATTPRPPSCDPPYTVDARGYQHPKPECL
jgi:serine/threonine-protein kinase